MTSSRPSDTLVGHLLDHLIDAHALPAGWHELALPGVDDPVVIGPGGLVVLGTRQVAVTHPDLAAHRPVEHDRRGSRSTVQLIAGIVADLVAETTGVTVTCTPVIVITDDRCQIVARPDQVPVIHRRRVSRWLATRPLELDHATIVHIRETVEGRAAARTR